MSPPRFIAAAALLLPHPAAAQHAGHAMPGMTMPPAQTHHHPTAPAPATTAAPPPSGTDLPPGDAPAPLPRADYLADAIWGADAMARSRETDLRREHGGMTVYQLLLNIAEVQARRGRDGYRWDGEAWIGGDIHRLALRSEGEAAFGRKPEQAEVQALYSRALDPYWNLQAGARLDLAPRSTAYAAIGVEGLTPYWFDVEATLFLSTRGDLRARTTAWYDQRVTQYLVLQPRVEANLSASDTPRDRVGAGLTDLEAGLRLRYERSRRLAPYVGISWERTFGNTARFRQARSDATGGWSLVTGLRAWF